MSDHETLDRTMVRFTIRRIFRRGFPLGVYRFLREKLVLPYAHFLLAKASKGRRETFTVVQIGANDGVHTDPISKLVQKLGWSALLVEPNPANFALLQRCYGSFPHVRLEQAAIAEDDGTVVLYRPKELPSGQPNPLKGKDSLDPQSFDKYAWMTDNWSELIEPLEVPALRLASLLKKHGLHEIDFFVCDTEGYDKVILDQLDFSQDSLQFVQFEYVHLKQTEVEALVARLRACGFRILYLRWDVFAFRTSFTMSRKRWNGAGLPL